MNTSDTFIVCGETFSIEKFPHLYRMYKASPENLEKQLESLANAWQGGSIVSAAQFLESDLNHG